MRLILAQNFFSEHPNPPFTEDHYNSVFFSPFLSYFSVCHCLCVCVIAANLAK